MSAPKAASIQNLADLSDPRRRKVTYPLINIVTMALIPRIHRTCGMTRPHAMSKPVQSPQRTAKISTDENAVRYAG